MISVTTPTVENGVIVEEHEFAQNKDNGVGADSSETPKTDKDGFMEAPEGEVPFD